MLRPSRARRGASGPWRAWEDSCPAAGLLAFQQNNRSSPQPTLHCSVLGCLTLRPAGLAPAR